MRITFVITCFALTPWPLIFVNGINMDCSFDVDNYSYPFVSGKRCVAKTSAVTEPNVTITSINSQVEDFYHKDNIKMFWLHDSTAHFMPSGVEKLLPDLEALLIVRTNLKFIFKKNLQSFPKLKMVWFYENDLESLESDLFEANLELRFVHFHTNKIKFIGENIFTPLKNLVQAYFKGNICVNTDADTLFKLQELKDHIKEKCVHILELRSVIDELKSKVNDLTTRNNDLVETCASTDNILNGVPKELVTKITKKIISPIELKCDFDASPIYISEIKAVAGTKCKVAGTLGIEYPGTNISKVVGKQPKEPLTALIAFDQSIRFLPINLAELFPKLETLLIERCKLTSIEHQDIESLSDIKVVIIRSNDLSSIGDGTFDTSAKLEYLDLSANKLKDLPAKAFAKLANLKTLILSNNQLTRLRSDILPRQKIIEFQADNNKLEQIETKILKALYKAKLIDLSGNICVDQKLDMTTYPKGSFIDFYFKVDMSCCWEDCC